MLDRMLHTAKGRAIVDLLAARSGLLVCGLFLLAGLGLAGDYGWGMAELTQRGTVKANLSYILGQADRVDTTIPHERFYGVAFELPLLLTEGAFGLEDYYYIHRLRLTVTHLLFLAGGFFCYLLAYRLFNNRLLALFALLLFLLHPRIYAHSFINPKDLPFLSMFAVALYLAERAFRKNTVGAFLLLGIAVGIAANLRIMGLMLLLAVVGMRVLDAGLARDWEKRKEIVITGGLFALAAGLTWYGLAPNGWGDPLAHLAGGLNLTTDHPTVTLELFQGEWFRSDELPAHFGLTRFVITTPPMALLLGVVGMAVLVGRGITRPRAIFRNARLRFWWLVAGCFGLPLLGIALTGSNIYDGWRLLYFIYAPFGLLAVGGLYWIAGGFSGLRWRQIGVYGLAGLGLGLTLLQMAQLHSWQHLYFNFLVDRTTPNYLRTQYEMHSWRVVFREALEYALARHPGEQLTIYTELREFTLHPADRRRVLFNSPVHEPDYYLIITDRHFEVAHRPDMAFNSQYPPVYNSSILSLRGLDGSRMDAAVAAGYEEIYRGAIAGEPIIREEGYAVYLRGRRLTFVKENCQPGEQAGQFGMKVYPAAGTPWPGRIPDLSAYDYLHNAGVRFGDKCLAALLLPDRPVAHLMAGRYANNELNVVWEAPHSFSRPGLRELTAELGDNRSMVTGEAGFELYRQGRRLIYYLEDCTAWDTASRFFLHITPEDAGDLYPERREYGFEVGDFEFSRRGARFDGRCVATVELPDYAIAGIRTGQYAAGQGKVWSVELELPESPRERRRGEEG